jgi:4-hydroxyphenylpyruvate dioxygenase
VSVILREGIAATSPVWRHVERHGDGVGNIRLVCRDVDGIVERARAHGVHVTQDADGARLDLLNDGTVVHAVQRQSVRPTVPSRRHEAPLMRAVDHVTYCLPYGAMDRIARLYRQVFGLADVGVGEVTDVGDDAAGMCSAVLRSSAGFTVVLTAPRTAASSGQTQRFLRAHNGAGVQHVAFAYDDLSGTVAQLRSRGVPLLAVPREHVEAARSRLRDRLAQSEALCREGILVDEDEHGFLFQLFTEPITDRRTLFFELIQRDGSIGFGARNVRALFDAVDALAQRDGTAGGAAHNTDLAPHASGNWVESLVSLARRIPFYRERLADADGRNFAAVLRSTSP